MLASGRSCPSGGPDATCHPCAKFHQYRAYRWDPTKGRFGLSETIPSTKKSHAAEETPLQTDRLYIVSKLTMRP